MWLFVPSASHKTNTLECVQWWESQGESKGPYLAKGWGCPGTPENLPKAGAPFADWRGHASLPGGQKEWALCRQGAGSKLNKMGCSRVGSGESNQCAKPEPRAEEMAQLHGPVGRWLNQWTRRPRDQGRGGSHLDGGSGSDDAVKSVLGSDDQWLHF